MFHSVRREKVRSVVEREREGAEEGLLFVFARFPVTLFDFGKISRLGFLKTEKPLIWPIIKSNRTQPAPNLNSVRGHLEDFLDQQ